jgi:5'-methylthioadenosine phosphorylase
MARRKTKQSKPGNAQAARIGIIGGSGLYTMPGLSGAREVRVKTPFGNPSDAFVIGQLEGRQVAFLSRHGRGHRLLPSEINYRANIYAMKLLGVVRIISMSAVGSLREELKPQDFVIPDQFFDRTRHRADTFFGAGLAAHIMFDNPTCAQVAACLGSACERAGVRVHAGGTYVCMEGPQFSTKAESHTYRQLRFDVIGMTNLTEAKLAREAEICYATCAMVTDYDCWHPEHDAVTIGMVIENLQKNAQHAQNVLRHAVSALPAQRDCKCAFALSTALITDRKMIPAATKRKLAAIIGKYIS